MSVLDANAFTGAPSATPSNPLAGTTQLLREMPRLLEYRAEADPDAEFIPKTIAGFAGGFLVMGTFLAILCSALILKHASHETMMTTMLPLTAFMIGIAGVASSLLLVGLKVRADHTGEELYARHWLNSLGTGAAYATIICGPWLFMQQGFVINRFIAAAVWMVLMAFPALAAKWTVQPHPHHDLPSQ